MSDALNELAAALAKAQAQIHGAEMSRVNPAFKSKYATLADVWNACRDALTKNGLSIVQLPSYVDGEVRITTILLHSSGQSIRETLALPVVKKDPQGLGSAISYGRRYALSAMVGVCPDEDDDGNAASRSQQGNGQRPQSRMQNASDPQRQGTRVVYKHGDPSDREAP